MKTLSNGRGALRDDAADSIARIDRAYGGPTPIESALRTFAEQWEAWLKYLNGGPLALNPNEERSVHMDGLAVDFGWQVYNWLGLWNGLGWNGCRANGFGWRRTVSSEVWHCEYDPNRDIAFAQERLGLVVDGIEGPATTSALRSYQAANGLTPDGKFGPATRAKMAAGPSFSQKVKDQQKATNAIINAGLAEDGKPGPATTAAIKRYQEILGVTADGVWGDGTEAEHRKLASAIADAKAGKRIAEDGEWGWGTSAKLQANLKVKVDGQLGPDTYRALQGKLGVAVDGIMGEGTRKAMQSAIGANPDGQAGPDTTRKLQAFLNAGKTFSPVKVPPVAPPPAAAPATPRKPLYPRAARGWLVPLSSDRPSGTVVDRLILHHQGGTQDDEGYFKSKNDRGSCPTWNVKKSGEVVELIAPDKKPSSTGRWNARSVAIETQNASGAPSWGISRESLDAIADIAAWLSKQKTLGGSPVSFKLDREHIIGHNETGAQTACPGPGMDYAYVIAKAKAILAEEQAPPPAPLEPETGPTETIPVDRGWLTSVLEKIKSILGK